MKNKNRIFQVMLIIAVAAFLASCCYKKDCGTSAGFRSICIYFAHFNEPALDSILQGYINLGRDSVYFNEYDLDSELPIQSYLIKWPYTTIGPTYYTSNNDSFYLNHRYFIISKPGETDTIANISYQKIRYEFDCNNCPGEHDYASRLINFKYTYKGKAYTDADTIFIY